MTKNLSRSLILALLVFSTTPLKADSIPEIVAKTKEAVVEIVTRDATGTPKTLGTVFFVSPNGSPVMDETGQVIGIATLVGAEGQKLSFAIPVEEVPAELLEPPGSAPPTATLTPAIEAKAYFDSGSALLNRKEYDKAIGDFTEAIRLDPNYTLAYFNRGLAYDYRGNYDKAVSDYNEAIGLEPNFVPSYFNRGIAYGHQRNYERAVSNYTQAIRLEPNYASAYYGRGYAYQEQGNFDEAISD